MNTISKISIEGGFYETKTNIHLKSDDFCRATVIYGGNGSGKSSIANALLEYKLGENIDNNEFKNIKLLDKASNEIFLSNENKNNIWVYSEKYIENNINWNNDNLGAIVMFGEQIEIDSLIKEKEYELDKKKEDQIKINLNKYLEKNGDFSISKTIEVIKSTLRQTWSEREKNIKKTSSANITDNILTQIYLISKIGKSAYFKKKKDFDEKIKKFLMIDSNQEKLSAFNIELITLEKYDKLKNLLMKKISKPGGKIIEDKLLTLITEGRQNLVMNSYEYFLGNKDECPYCMQKVSNEHRELLLDSIRVILNEEVEYHRKELTEIQVGITKISLDLDYLRKYKNELIIDFSKNIDLYNKIITNLSSEIIKKTDNPFEPIEINYSLKELLENLNKQYVELMDFINNFNKSIDAYDVTKAELFEENKILARFEIDEFYKKNQELTKDLQEEQLLLDKLTNEIKSIKEEIKALNSKKSSVDIALNEINKNLHQIFSGKNRLSLELDENSNYRVSSRGKILKLKKLSTGERNVITLCYFFAHLRNNTNAFKKFSSPYYIVLDDPISSLDFDNKIGIYAYFRKILGEIINNNDKSNILILTHDLEIVFKLNKVFDDIRKELGINKFDCQMRILSNKTTESVDIKKMNNYSWNIDIIYEYSISDPDHDNINDFYIGNILRKTLEAYSTFNYKKDISGLTQSDLILNKIDDDELREHFKNRMIRLLLHSESHTEEPIKAIIDHDSFEQFSREERIQVSRDVLCLLYLLDAEHIKSHLPHDETKIKNIEKWIKECKYNSE